MPFVPLDPKTLEKYKPCPSPEHNPPTHIVIKEPCVWVCPACGKRHTIIPNRVTC